MNLNSLRALYVHELNDLYNAEHQLLDALPRMAKAASFLGLRLNLERQLYHTHEHVVRIERAFSLLEEKPTRIICRAMVGLIEEGEEMIQAEGNPAIKDAGLISAAQRVGHYGIVGYGRVLAYAETLREVVAVKILTKTLDEERATEEGLMVLAERLIHAELVLA